MRTDFRLRWPDRLRALLLGRVRHVYAPAPPIVVRSRFGGNSLSLDEDAFGFVDPGVSRGSRPLLTVTAPSYLRFVACPCCGQVVDASTIRKPSRAALSEAMRWQRDDAALAEDRADYFSSLDGGRKEGES